MKRLLVLSLCILLFVGCEKKGCMDSFAENFDYGATKDDGTCAYLLYACSGSDDYTCIPDYNFEEYLIEYEYDDIFDGQVLTANISSVDSLDLRGFVIFDLTGIEDFTALTYLDCSGNQLTSLDLSNNTALTFLHCSGNQLMCVNLKNGNNLNLTFPSFGPFVSNPNLTCVEVDDPNWATQHFFWEPFGQWTYSTNCNYPVGCF